MTEEYENQHENLHHSKELAKRLLDFCEFLPLWSAVMTTSFNFGNITETSASSGSPFNEIKNRIFKHRTLPLRLDDFLKVHTESTIGAMNLLGSKQKIGDQKSLSQTACNQKKRTLGKEEIENWRGEGVEDKKKINKKELCNCRSYNIVRQ